MDPSFLNEWVDRFLGGRTIVYRDDDHREYSRLWRRQDYQQVIRRFVDTIYDKTLGRVALEPYLLVLFRHPDSTPDLRELQEREDALLDELIRERREDHQFLKFLFEVVAHLDVQRRRSCLDTLFGVNTDFRLFRSLPLEPHVRTARGSWVPVLRQQIEYFESLLSLCDSVDLLPHRQWLEERIASLRSEMTREKRSDFMSDE
jgi:hypothetical protein